MKLEKSWNFDGTAAEIYHVGRAQSFLSTYGLCSCERRCRSGRDEFAPFYEHVDLQLTAVYADGPDERRARHDS